MAKLLTGTRIYGTGTVDTQLFVSGTNSATSTTTGALQVVGGVGIGGNLYVGGTIYGASLSGTASTATNSDNIKTILQVSSATYYPTFVDANNSTAAYEALYTTSSLVINPGTGKIGIGNPTPNARLHIGAETEVNITNQSLFVQGSKTGYAGFKGLPLGQLFIYDDTASSAGSGGAIGFGANTGASQRTWIASINSERDSATNDATNYGGSLVFYTRPAQATPEERVRITSTGSVGIGTSTPLSKFVVNGGTVNSTTYTSSEARIADGTLHLMKTSAGGVFEALRAINNDTTVGTTVRLLAAATSDPFNNANGGKVFIDAVRTASNMDLIFSLNDAGGAAAVERLRILGSGAIAFNGSTSYGVSGQILQSNGNAAPTWISTGSLAAANATTATHLSGGVAGQIPYQTAPGVTSFLSTGTAGNVLVSNGSSAPTYNNTLTLTGTTAATSTTTGALQVVGGVGVGGDLYIRGDILTNDTTFNLINTNATTVNFAGAATALTMGASGSGTTNVRNNLTVSGNLTVQGTTTIVDSTLTNIADPILTLGGGTGNTAPIADDNKDRGVAFKWVNDGGTTSTGFFGYDDSTGHFTYVQTATITNEVVSGTKGAMDVNLAGGSAMAIVYQSSPSNTAFLAAGTSGYILQTNGTGSAPSWVAASGVSAGSATYADQIRTVAQTASAVYYPTFVDSNNASNAYELVYTTGTFVINPATGYIGMGTASPSRPLHVFTLGTATQGIAAFEAKASGFVIQDNGSQNGNVELVGYKQTSSTYHNILIRGSGDGLLVQTGTGNVGIGDTAPGTKLTVLGAGGSTLGTNGYLVHIGGTDSGVDPVRYMIGFSHGNNSTSTNVRAAIGGMVTTGGAGNLIFETGSSGNQVERMRITGSGGVSFGTGGGNYGSSGQLLQSNGNAAPTWVNASSVGVGSVNTVLQTASASYYLTFVDSNNASATAESVYTTSSFQINPSTGNIQIGMTGQDYQPSSGGNHTLRLNAANTSSIGFHDSGSTIGNLKFSGAYGFEIGAYDGLYGPHNTILHGSVGVGTQSPTAKFTINNAGSTSAAFYADIGNPSGASTLFEHTGAGTPVPFRFRKSGFSGASPNYGLFYLHMNDGTVGNGSNLYFNLNNSSGTEIEYAGLGAIIRSNTAASEQGDLALYVMQNGTGRTERMRITSAGAIAFNGASSYGSSGQVLKSNGNAPPTWIDQSTIAAGSAPLTNTYVGYGSASNLLTGSSNVTWNGTAFYVNGNINAVQGQTASFNASAIGTLGSPNQGTHAGYLLLAKAYISGFQTTSMVEGEFVLKRGGTSSGNRTDRYRVSSCSGYSSEGFVVQVTSGSGVGDHYFVSTVKVTYSGTVYHAIKTTVGGGLPDNGVLFFGSSSNAGMLYVDATYVSSESSFGNYTFLTSAGNLGFGTSSPSYKVHVASGTIGINGSYTSGNFGLFVQGLGSGSADARAAHFRGFGGHTTIGATGPTIVLQNADGTTNNITKLSFETASNGEAVSINCINTNHSSFYGDIAFNTRGAVSGYSEKLRIMADGNVGIGVTSPEYLVDLGTLSEEYTTDKIRFNSYNGPAGGVSGYGGTGGSGTSLGSGIIWKPNYGGYSKRSAGILQIGEGNYFRAGLAFYTNNITDSTTDWTEAMRIGSNGNVSIGAGSNPGLQNKFEVAGTAGQLFSVSDSFTGTIFSANDVSGIPSIEVLDTGLVKFAQYGGQVGISTGTVVSGSALSVYGIISTIGTGGEIRASSEITAYYSSDRRLKENIKLIENPITILDQIRGVTFDWTDEHMARRGGEDGYFVRKHDIGVIAQEVQAVLPELVGTREDGYLAVKYEKMVALLIEAIKEQQKSIDMLKLELEKIKKQ